MRDLHTLLLETEIREGKMVCGNCGHEYKIKEGIANFLLPSHLGEWVLFLVAQPKNMVVEQISWLSRALESRVGPLEIYMANSVQSEICG